MALHIKASSWCNDFLASFERQCCRFNGQIAQVKRVTSGSMQKRSMHLNRIGLWLGSSVGLSSPVPKTMQKSYVK
ncbi:uncharacterized protein G2W53_004449 [Senna tora]|uniref:Uncharacterized protein n=1 Tax=Senna tora TaxID=362788 RepID=A0A834XDE8_9FABA|nr:uncharacterized protein G2W53_004449 [Senna tora]